MRILLFLIFTFISTNLLSQRIKRSYSDTTTVLIKKGTKSDNDTTFFIVSAKREHKADSEKIDSFMNFWLGKPYVYGGTSAKGIDCSGFTQKIFNHIFGINIPRTAYEQYKKSEKVPLNDIQTGDLIFFISRLSPSGWHVAFYLGDGKILHSANRRLGVVMQSLNKEMEKRIYAVGRYLNK